MCHGPGVDDQVSRHLRKCSREAGAPIGCNCQQTDNAESISALPAHIVQLDQKSATNVQLEGNREYRGKCKIKHKCRVVRVGTSRVRVHFQASKVNVLL